MIKYVTHRVSPHSSKTFLITLVKAVQVFVLCAFRPHTVLAANLAISSEVITYVIHHAPKGLILRYQPKPVWPALMIATLATVMELAPPVTLQMITDSSIPIL